MQSGDRPARERSELLLAWAREAGFDRAGIAPLAPIERGEAFCAWLSRGDQAGMSYLERRVETRLRPERRLAGARAVLCVALHYPSGPEEPAGDLWPRVARYARGRDYHGLMEERLADLARRIAAAFPGVDWKVDVDTGPVLERELAARAGLGAFGKHTQLLHPQHGSWFLLGELFLTLDLSAGETLADPCGSCSRCLAACPTGALPEPYRLDARRCIAYWTIEHRGAIPTEIRPLLGDWVFGCDLCQEACPWNGPVAGGDPALALSGERAELDLVGLLRLERPRYLDLFRGSPLKRPKLGGLKRNAAIAMGNRGESRYVPALVGCLAGEEDPLVRQHAAWALGRIGTPAAVRALAAARAGEAVPEVRAEIDASVGKGSI